MSWPPLATRAHSRQMELCREAKKSEAVDGRHGEIAEHGVKLVTLDLPQRVGPLEVFATSKPASVKRTGVPSQPHSF